MRDLLEAVASAPLRRHRPPGRARAELRAAHPAAAPVPTYDLHDGEPTARRVAPRRSVTRVSLLRRCSRTACGRPAATTLTYVYADQTAVLGPLATYAEPHAYDLCDAHSQRLSAPRGWEVLRLVADDPPGPPPTTCSPWPTRCARPPSPARPRAT